jgi:HAD superfamily hydrolase (TIGR01509 family)
MTAAERDVPVPGQRPLRGVLLDVDGTLIDSNLAHAEAWHDALVEAGFDAPPVERLRRMIGMGGDKILPATVGLQDGTPEAEAISKRRSERFREAYLPKLRATPGALDLVRGLEDRGLEVGIATSAQPDELEALLRQAGLPLELARRAASSGDVDASKPDPDIVHAALDRIGLDHDEVVLIGDTPYDVESGARAGVWVIALRCGGWEDDGLAGAVGIFDDPADLLAHLDETPLGRIEPSGPAT